MRFTDPLDAGPGFGTRPSTHPADVQDLDGHGTWVTSTLLSVSPGVEVIPIKVCREMILVGCVWSQGSVLVGLEWALELGVDIVNLSGSTADNALGQFVSRVFDDSFERLAGAGITAFVSSGNHADRYSGINPWAVSASKAGHIAVGGSDDWGSDAVSRSQGGDELSIIAPYGVVAAELGGGETVVFGTSFSAPLAAGLAAGHRSGGIGREDLSSVILDWTIDLDPEGWNARTGYGRVIGGISIEEVYPTYITAGVTSTITVEGRNLHRPVELLVNGEPVPFRTVAHKFTGIEVEFDLAPEEPGVKSIQFLHPAGLESEAAEIQVTNTRHQLTVTKSGEGTVTSTPGGISIGSGSSADSHEFEEDTNVTLTATPAEGWRVESWSGDCSGSDNTCTVTMSRDREVSVTFEEIPPQTYTLTVNKTGQGTVFSDPSGIAIGTQGSSDSHQFQEGTTVVLTVTPSDGWQVESWGGACSGSGSFCTLTMTQDNEVVVGFTAV